MSSIQLFEFQQLDANTIAQRFSDLLKDRNAPTITCLVPREATKTQTRIGNNASVGGVGH